MPGMSTFNIFQPAFYDSLLFKSYSRNDEQISRFNTFPKVINARE